MGRGPTTSILHNGNSGGPGGLSAGALQTSSSVLVPRPPPSYIHKHHQAQDTHPQEQA